MYCCYNKIPNKGNLAKEGQREGKKEGEKKVVGREEKKEGKEAGDVGLLWLMVCGYSPT